MHDSTIEQREEKEFLRFGNYVLFSFNIIDTDRRCPLLSR